MIPLDGLTNVSKVKVLKSMSVGWAHITLDLVFMSGEPWVVIEDAGDKVPRRMLPLDPARLFERKGADTRYLYDGYVDDLK